MSTIDTISELRGALAQLLEQVYQMGGLFPGDEALKRAMRDAEEALS